ncbi:MAG: hypothetical protein JW725_00385 [Candidatus Babeliaceae bacterium]|nr:hypothetical protein [Candidatus Babeliaceae bacterium]
MVAGKSFLNFICVTFFVVPCVYAGSGGELQQFFTNVFWVSSKVAVFSLGVASPFSFLYETRRAKIFGVSGFILSMFLTPYVVKDEAPSVKGECVGSMFERRWRQSMRLAKNTLAGGAIATWISTIGGQREFPINKAFPAGLIIGYLYAQSQILSETFGGL